MWDFQQAIESGDVEALMRKIEALLAGVPYDNINDVEYRERDAQVAAQSDRDKLVNRTEHAL